MSNPPSATRGRTPRDWIIARADPRREALAASARVSPLVAQCLLSRGIAEPGEVTRFLSPAFADLLPPESLPGAVDVAGRLVQAIRQRRRIVIYGDYDVDGITATTILWHTLRLAGGDVEYYVPSRIDEGYGLNREALVGLAQRGAGVVISVDCGITAVAEAEAAAQLGLELLITDHHQPGSRLPPAAAIAHPTALGESANPHLCGAGVALKVAWATAREICGSQRVSGAWREWLVDACAFAAMGLIADVVPLLGENRILAHFGLAQLASVRNVGVQALIDAAGLSSKRNVDDFDIGYKLAPRLNAIGRLGHAREAIELFTTADEPRAREIARELDRLNRERQTVEQGILKQAEARVVEGGLHSPARRALVLAGEEWHAGVIGIVAARLVERFCRPTVLISLENGSGQGSARSIPAFPLYEALAACSSHLKSFGGHAMAAGLRVASDRVEQFTEAFLGEAAQRLTEQDMRPKLRLDDEVELRQVSADVVRHLQRLAPHGPGNARPRLATTPVELAEPPRCIGQSGAHLSFVVRQGDTFRRAIAFGMGAECERLSEHRRLRVAFEPLLNVWKGRESAELSVVDWKPAE